MGIRERGWGKMGEGKGEVRVWGAGMRWEEGEGGDGKSGWLEGFWHSVVCKSCTVGLRMGYSHIWAL